VSVLSRLVRIQPGEGRTVALSAALGRFERRRADVALPLGTQSSPKLHGMQAFMSDRVA
jgi:hypothetical protein